MSRVRKGKGFSPITHREISDTESLSRRSSHHIICRMLISVSSLLAGCVNKFVDSVHANTLMRIRPCAFASDLGLRKVGWIDAA